MATLNDDIRAMLADTTRPVTRQWLDQALAEHPYYTLPLLLYLKRNGTRGNEELLSRLAIACPDRRALAMQLGDGMEAFANFYPPESAPETPDTDTTIDRFLDTFGHSSDKEIAAISQAIFNPMPDYADVLAAQEHSHDTAPSTADTQSEQDRLINDFIAQNQERERQVSQAPAQPHVEESELAEIADAQIDEPTSVDDTMFSESLARSYIAGQKYAQALEIIEHISADNPEKSIYFADQIRFLRKLVKNQQLLNQ